MNDSALELHGVSVRVVGRALVSDVDLTVRKGEHWVVLGPNGAGKTTMLSVAAAVRHPTSGTAHVLGKQLGKVDLRELRRHIGLVAASQRLVDEALLEEEGATARTVVLTGHSGTSAPSGSSTARPSAPRPRPSSPTWAARTWPTASSSSRSQGERARVRVARALMADPEILLLDEPFAGLDLPAREDPIEALEDLAARPGLTTVLVTHHLEEVPATTTHALLMRDARVLVGGPVEETLTGEHLSECFGRPLRIDRHDGRYYARRG